MAKRRVVLKMYATIGKNKTTVKASDEHLEIMDLITFRVALDTEIENRFAIKNAKQIMEDIEKINKEILG